MSAPEGPEFSTGAPLPPAEAQQPTTPEPAEPTWQEGLDALAPKDGEVPTTLYDSIVTEVRSRLGDTASDDSAPVDETPPNFDQQVTPSEDPTPTEEFTPAQPETEASPSDQIPLTGDPEATIEVTPVDPVVQPAEAVEPSGRHALQEPVVPTPEQPAENALEIEPTTAVEPAETPTTTPFPKRVPQAEIPAITTALRAARVGEFTAGYLRARREARADLSAEMGAAEPLTQSTDDEQAALKGSATAGVLFLKGADLSGLVPTPLEIGEVPVPTLTKILVEGMNAQGEAVRWPSGNPDAAQ